MEQPTAILAIAADRFANRATEDRNVFAALARGLDPRAPGHVVCIREGTLYDVELPTNDLHNNTEFVAQLYRAEHVVGLEEHLDVAEPANQSLVPDPSEVSIRLWACEAWIDYRSEVRVSERYIRFPEQLRWERYPLTPALRDRYLFDFEAPFTRHGLNDDQATTILEHHGCSVTALDLGALLDQWIAPFASPDQDFDFGSDLE